MITRSEPLDGRTRLEVQVARKDDLEPALRLVRETVAAGERRNAFVDFPGGEIYLKASPLRGKARWRHFLRGLGGAALPRFAELENLRWLREQGFRAAAPLFAAAVRASGLPSFQLLATRRVEGARTLEERWPDASPAERKALCAGLGRLAAKLHEERFVHRDFYPRNLLVDETDDLWILDAWRGGRGLKLRGPECDLGCLFTRAPFDAEEEREILESYLSARRRPSAVAFLERLRRERDRLERRAEREAQRSRRRKTSPDSSSTRSSSPPSSPSGPPDTTR